ncbi:MAG: PEP-CTERM sorting domain-containing protein [Verrucomicrobiales bacterium]|nr:PEP-CTERM sorting domain-containing protein [Verrucomicrobiales bacterium]
MKSKLYRSPFRFAHGRWVASSIALLGCTASAWSSDLSFRVDDIRTVPDGNTSGLVSVLDLPPIDGQIADIDITLNIAGLSPGGWNGDLYVLVSHAGAASVLVNRPGLTSVNPFGYGDNGLSDVRFDDDAGAGDFHEYQTVLNASGDTELPITGTWEPDARGADPGAVLPTSSRSRFLSAFDGRAGGGEWRLFIADLALGGKFQLESWEIHITLEAAPIPETSRSLALASATLVALAGFRWHRRRA